MKRFVFITAGLLLIFGLILYFRRPQPPEVPVAAVRRATIVQLLTTNGKIEAVDAVAVYARAPVTVLKVNVREGDKVRRGQRLAEVDDRVAREALARAKARLEIARADSSRVERGGSQMELADLDAAIASARLDREAAEREIAALQRLVERQAASRAELLEQQQRFIRAESQLAALERKRRALIGPEDRERVRGRIQEAEAAVAEAATALSQTEIVSPADGVLYHLSLRPGAFYPAGSLIGEIGQLDKVRVRVLVDEPDLGRLQAGQPVRVTWDALPGSSWEGLVERLPAEVEMFGTRSVGEVLCTIDNAGGRLLPNVSVNVEIRTGVSQNALSIPREAVIRGDGETYVFVVKPDGAVSRQPVQVGIRDTTRVEIVQGLGENELVILPGQSSFTTGQKVRPHIAA